MNERIIKQIKETAEEMLGIEVNYFDVPKANITKTGFALAGVRTSPIYYITEEDIRAIEGGGMSIETLVKGMKDFFEENMLPNTTEDKLMAQMQDKEFLLSNCRLQAINAAKNEELLKKIVSYHDLDLAFIVRVMVETPFGAGLIAVPKKSAELAGVTEEELLKAAEKNTKDIGFRADMFSDVMGELMPDAPINPLMTENLFLIVRSKDEMYGSTILAFPDLLKDLIGKDIDMNFMVIPSSVHEIILVPAMETNEKAAEDFREMIMSVNSTLEEEIVLSNNPYLLMKNGKLAVA